MIDNRKKQMAAMAAFYTLSFIAGILIPNFITAAIGVKATESFCDTNKDICNKYVGIPSIGNIGNSLIQNVKSDGYTFAGLGGLSAGLLTGLLLFLVVFAPKWFCCPSFFEKQTDDNEETPSSTWNDESNHGCALFKKFKDNVLPTKGDIYQLLMTSAVLIGSTSFLAFVNARNISNIDICQSLFPSVPKCIEHFPNATHDQLKIAADFSDSLYKTMLSSGIILATVMNVLIAIGTMATAAGIKYWMSTAEDRLLKINENEGYGSTAHEYEL